ncbi:MAG: hypothetical protein HY606_08895 [Planctomycetes bacterium]|nr:hypothetical protein [Planctomycetota bacterium]
MRALIILLFLVHTRDDEIKQYTKEVEKTRKLKFNNKVKVQYTPRDEFDTYYKKMNQLCVPDSYFKHLQVAYSCFKIIAGNLNIEDLTKNSSQAYAGIYYPINKKLLIPVPQVANFNNKSIEKLSVTHELVHALTDQHYNLMKLKSPNLDLDKSLALNAVIEGDATLHSYKIIHKGMFNSRKGWILQQLNSFNNAFTQNSGMLSLSILGMFPYTKGFEFVSYIDEKEGVTGINKLYTDPPLSTEQILHPEKYKKDFPREITVSKTLEQSMEKNDCTKLTEGVIGEIGTQLFLKGLGLADYTKLAEGWDGDKYIIFADENGKNILVWYTIWDSAKEAKEFYNAFKSSKKLGKRYSIHIYGDMVIITNKPSASLSKILNSGTLKQYATSNEIRALKLEEPIVF